MVDIILVTYNRPEMLKRTLQSLFDRTSSVFRLILVDNCSTDNTQDVVNYFKDKYINKIVNIKTEKNGFFLSAIKEGLKLVNTDYFVTMQDDVVVPLLTPDWLSQLIDLIKKYDNAGAIGCRIQRIPNMNWTDDDISPARKSLASYCRIHKKDYIDSIGGFGDRRWEAAEMVKRIRKSGKEAYWANNIWCDHIGYCPGKGYLEKPEFGFKDLDVIGNEYPKINPLTNVPYEE